jgi:hypothetical protein
VIDSQAAASRVRQCQVSRCHHVSSPRWGRGGGNLFIVFAKRCFLPKIIWGGMPTPILSQPLVSFWGSSVRCYVCGTC